MIVGVFTTKQKELEYVSLRHQFKSPKLNYKNKKGQVISHIYYQYARAVYHIAWRRRRRVDNGYQNKEEPRIHRHTSEKSESKI
jgi:hypothetical protein